MTSLNIFWYVIIIASMIFYAMLDGFDLGVGALHLFARKDEDRRIFLNAIGPIWDGNEVWLVIVIGGLFAGFPYAYATLLSAFYVPLTILIAGLIFRACAIEFRSKVAHGRWRSIWDGLFFGASVVIAFAVGVALGNLIQGIPLDAKHDYVGGVLFSFLRPYALLMGVLVLALFMMHGAIFLVMKTEGELQKKVMAWVNPTIVFFIMTYAIVTMVTLIYQTHMTEHIRARPYLFPIVLLNFLAIANIPREISRGNMGYAFLSSCGNIATLLALFAIGSFPTLIRSTIDPANFSLTIQNSVASPTTMVVLMVIVLIGIPLVLGYFYYIYKVFHGKVKMDHMSY